MKRITSLHSVSLTATIALLVSPGAWADLIARIGIETGGDTIIEVSTNDGSEELKGGGLAHFEFGFDAHLLSSDPAWITEATIGYKFDSATFQNGDMDFTRGTANLMQYYRLTPVVRVGAGVTYHFNVNAEVDIPSIAVGSADYDDALGFMVAVDFTISEAVNLGIRATQIEYEASEFANADALSGNSLGGYVSINF